MGDPLTVLVLGGGPDRERPVSLKSAAAVADALRRSGHFVREADVTPEDPEALQQPGDVVFPVLHGKFGEGGPLQRMLERQGRPYVGSGPEASRLAMDKRAAKQRASAEGVRTPPFQLLGTTGTLEIDFPVAAKPLAEGSSFDVHLCYDRASLEAVREGLGRQHSRLLVEKLIRGREVTVGIVEGQTLPPLEVRVSEGFYDYAAKYERDDTEYRFDIGLTEARRREICEHAWRVHATLGCRDVSRCDFIVDADDQPWFLEINTMPGFTDHSLVPKAAAHLGIPMEELCDRLVRRAVTRWGESS